MQYAVVIEVALVSQLISVSSGQISEYFLFLLQCPFITANAGAWRRIDLSVELNARARQIPMVVGVDAGLPNSPCSVSFAFAVHRPCMRRAFALQRSVVHVILYYFPRSQIIAALQTPAAKTLDIPRHIMTQRISRHLEIQVMEIQHEPTVLLIRSHAANHVLTTDRRRWLAIFA